MPQADDFGCLIEILVERHSPLLPIYRRPEAQGLAQRQRRLQRIGMAKVVDDSFFLSCAFDQKMADFRRDRPARRRSELTCRRRSGR
jgi:hypothetical protein